MDVIKNHSNENTVIYLNIPDGRFQAFMKKNHFEKLQIVDEVYQLSEILIKFGVIGFTPSKIDMYGIDVVYQYNEIVFISDKKLGKYYSAISQRMGKA
jgi:hypothetical protein